jgi:CHASE2 domain-containing sensor protein
MGPTKRNVRARRIFAAVSIVITITCVICASYFADYEYILVIPALILFGYIRSYGKELLHSFVRPRDAAQKSAAELAGNEEKQSNRN